MHFRVACTEDIPALMAVRMSVQENVLVTPSLATHELYEQYLNHRGRGWVCAMNGIVAGFAIADTLDNSVWALFVHPAYEGRGIGRRLHDQMLDWYFALGKEKIALTTAPATRAERFYRANGWKGKGYKNGEICFELLRAQWQNKNAPQY